MASSYERVEERVGEEVSRIEELFRRRLEEELQRRKELLEVLLVAVVLSFFLNILASCVVESPWPSSVGDLVRGLATPKGQLAVLSAIAVVACLALYRHKVLHPYASLYSPCESFSVRLSSIVSEEIAQVLERARTAEVDISEEELVKILYELTSTSLGDAYVVEPPLRDRRAIVVTVGDGLATVRADVNLLNILNLYEEAEHVYDVKVDFTVCIDPKRLSKEKHLHVYIQSIREHTKIVTTIILLNVVNALAQILRRRQSKRINQQIA